MSVDKHIAEAPYCKQGLMICETCKKKIETGLYVIAHYYDIKYRGNEHDTYKVFCPECTKGQNVWKNYFKQQEKEKQEALKNLEKYQIDAIRFIKNAKHIHFEQNGCFVEITVRKE